MGMTQPVASANNEPNVSLPTSIRFSALLVLVAVCVGPGPARAAGSTPKAHARSRVLYAANWRHGLRGWSGAVGAWSTSKGTLVTMGDGHSTVIAPYSVHRSSYTVSVKFRLIKLRGLGMYVANSFGILFRGGSGASPTGLAAGIFDYRNPGGRHVLLAMVTDPRDPTIAPSRNNYKQIQAPTGWFTYQLRVSGNHMRFTIGGQTLANTSQRAHRSGVHIGIFSNTTELEVRDFKVTAG